MACFCCSSHTSKQAQVEDRAGLVGLGLDQVPEAAEGHLRLVLREGQHDRRDLGVDAPRIGPDGLPGGGQRERPQALLLQRGGQRQLGRDRVGLAAGGGGEDGGAPLRQAVRRHPERIADPHPGVQGVVGAQGVGAVGGGVPGRPQRRRRVLLAAGEEQHEALLEAWEGILR